MQPPAVEQYISRDDAIRQLSRIRYPGQCRDIDRSTLHRWRNLAHVYATKNFNAEEMGRLIRVASLAYQGLSYSQIQKHLGVKNDDQHQQQTEQAAAPWGGFDYSNPYG